MEAFSAFKNTILNHNKSIRSLYKEATLAISLQQFDHAKILLIEIKQQQPRDALWMHGFGNLYHYQGEPTLAYHYYMQAAKLKFSII